MIQVAHLDHRAWPSWCPWSSATDLILVYENDGVSVARPPTSHYPKKSRKKPVCCNSITLRSDITWYEKKRT